MYLAFVIYFSKAYIRRLLVHVHVQGLIVSNIVFRQAWSHFLTFFFINLYIFIYLSIFYYFKFIFFQITAIRSNGTKRYQYRGNIIPFLSCISFNILGISTRIYADLGRFKGALWVKTILCMYFKLITGCMIIAFERILISLFRKPQNAYQHWNIRNIALYIGAAPSIWL